EAWGRTGRRRGFRARRRRHDAQSHGQHATGFHSLMLLEGRDQAAADADGARAASMISEVISFCGICLPGPHILHKLASGSAVLLRYNGRESDGAHQARAGTTSEVRPALARSDGDAA